MKKSFLLCLVYYLFLCSCKNNGTTQYATGSDTAQIINRIFNSQKISEDLPSTIHTIYLIKSKRFPYYNNSWPNDVGKLSIVYMEETPKNTERPRFGSKLTDPPIRYVITKFSLKADSANVNVYSINFLMDYYFKFVKKDNNWIITSSSWSVE